MGDADVACLTTNAHRTDYTVHITINAAIKTYKHTLVENSILKIRYTINICTILLLSVRERASNDLHTLQLVL